jgi:hypothetical protein
VHDQILVHDYDATEFDFAERVTALLGVPRLEDLHRGTHFPLFTRETDQSTHFHAAFYEVFDELAPLYHRFVREFVRPLFAEDICYQRVPTFRVHLPGNVAVGQFHRDSAYSHPDGELDFWLPLTDVWGTNTVWVAQDVESDECTAVPVRKGQVLTFDAVNRQHGNVVNDTGVTRVSFDFRVIPLSRYHPNDRKTINTGMRLVIGEYFTLLPDDDGAT